MNQSAAGTEGAPTVRYGHQIEVKVFLASVVGVLASSAAVSWLALAQLVPSYIAAWTESQRLALEKQTLAIQSILAKNEIDRKNIEHDNLRAVYLQAALDLLMPPDGQPDDSDFVRAMEYANAVPSEYGSDQIRRLVLALSPSTVRTKSLEWYVDVMSTKLPIMKNIFSCTSRSGIGIEYCYNSDRGYLNAQPMAGIPATIDIKVPPDASRFQVTLDEFGVCDRQEKGLAVVTIFKNGAPAWGPLGPFGPTDPTPVDFAVAEGDRLKLEVKSQGDGGCDDQVWRSARFSSAP